jgi:hypothetical protein
MGADARHAACIRMQGAIEHQVVLWPGATTAGWANGLVVWSTVIGIYTRFILAESNIDKLPLTGAVFARAWLGWLTWLHGRVVAGDALASIRLADPLRKDIQNGKPPLRNGSKYTSV